MDGGGEEKVGGGVMVSGLDSDLQRLRPHDDEEVGFVNCCV